MTIARSAPGKRASGLSAGGSRLKRTAGVDLPVATPATTIGVVCSGDVAVYRDDVKQALERGIAERPDAEWLCLTPKSDRLTHDLLVQLGVKPEVLELDSRFKIEGGGDYRRAWRDGELLRRSDELIVFHKRAGHSPWREKKKWGEANGIYKHLFVIDLGPERVKKK